MLYFILGLVIGSFLNVCIYRLPRGESLLYPSSHCPHCGHAVPWFDLIPLVSYVCLLGKCRYCRGKISLRYPAVELITGLIFLTLSVKYPIGRSTVELFFYLIFASLLIIAFFIDLKEQIIPDSITITGISAGLFLVVVRWIILGNPQGLKLFASSLAGAALGFGLLYFISLFGKWMFKKEAMGEGDVYLAALLGLYLGWQGLILAVFLAFFSAAVVAVFLLLCGKIKRGSYIPFGPALAGGGIIAVFLGEQIINWYLCFAF